MRLFSRLRSGFAVGIGCWPGNNHYLLRLGLLERTHFSFPVVGGGNCKTVCAWRFVPRTLSQFPPPHALSNVNVKCNGAARGLASLASYSPSHAPWDFALIIPRSARTRVARELFTRGDDMTSPKSTCVHTLIDLCMPCDEFTVILSLKQLVLAKPVGRRNEYVVDILAITTNDNKLLLAVIILGTDTWDLWHYVRKQLNSE